MRPRRLGYPWRRIQPKYLLLVIKGQRNGQAQDSEYKFRACEDGKGRFPKWRRKISRLNELVGPKIIAIGHQWYQSAPLHEGDLSAEGNGA
ncbi:hypothetical protein QVD17_19979 [Tagetes erecta]|uniref:Uncharacterized protein n=1 Tax=Tagetes erecta TaxID=13708 RepID=A0AAD8KRY2_TARER|nr:hypothetical protein QVD17_19979 [Tagetes erecta]